MPRALAVPVREEIVRRHQQGQELAAIAVELHLSYNTVRQIWRLYRTHGPAGLTPRYHACARTTLPSHIPIIQHACELKRLHPTWGAPLIHLKLENIFENQNIPSIRTLQYSFRKAGVNRPRRHRRPPQVVVAARRVHEVWQVDAVEKAKLATAHEASWLTVTDELSGAILATELSPPGAMATNDSRRGAGVVPPRLHTVGVA
jgi:hypothetical protein